MGPFYDHPKVKRARQLLREADLEIRNNLKKREAARICKCGHRRDQHATSHSVNYTGGVCHRCDCLNFLAVTLRTIVRRSEDGIK